MRTVLALLLGLFVSGCGKLGDPNAEPTYGKTGLPKNCKAIIQENVRAWRAREYSADETMESIDRNCGPNGRSWNQ